MNKKLVSSLFNTFILLMFVCLSKNTSAQYKISQIVESNKLQILPPYKYDGFQMSEFTFDLVNKNIPIEYTAFKGQKYQLLFCSSGFDEAVTISIYDKKEPAIKVAEKILDAKTTTWTYETSKPATYSIVYEIPPSETDVEHKACIVMLIGFTGK